MLFLSHCRAMGLVARKSVYGVSDKARLNPVSSATVRDSLENSKFDYGKFRYDTFQKANNKSADHTAWMRRLVCAFVVRKPPKTSFPASRPSVSRTCANTLCADWLTGLSCSRLQSMDIHVDKCFILMSASKRCHNQLNTRTQIIKFLSSLET